MLVVTARHAGGAAIGARTVTLAARRRAAQLGPRWRRTGGCWRSELRSGGHSSRLGPVGRKPVRMWGSQRQARRRARLRQPRRPDRRRRPRRCSPPSRLLPARHRSRSPGTGSHSRRTSPRKQMAAANRQLHPAAGQGVARGGGAGLGRREATPAWWQASRRRMWPSHAPRGHEVLVHHRPG